MSSCRWYILNTSDIMLVRLGRGRSVTKFYGASCQPVRWLTCGPASSGFSQLYVSCVNLMCFTKVITLLAKLIDIVDYNWTNTMFFFVVHTFPARILDEKFVLRMLHFLTHRTPSHGFGSSVPPCFIPPWSCCSVEVKKGSSWPSTLIFWGKRKLETRHSNIHFSIFCPRL